MSRLPTCNDLIRLISAIQGELAQYGLGETYLTIGLEPDTGEWEWQTGDNSFSGPDYRYPVWALGTVDNETDPAELAKYMLGQLEEMTNCLIRQRKEIADYTG